MEAIRKSGPVSVEITLQSKHLGWLLSEYVTLPQHLPTHVFDPTHDCASFFQFNCNECEIVHFMDRRNQPSDTRKHAQ